MWRIGVSAEFAKYTTALRGRHRCGECLVPASNERRGPHRDKVQIQFTSQVLPSSVEKLCSIRAAWDERLSHT